MARRRMHKNWALTGTMTLIAMIINLPIILMVLNSFQPTEAIVARLTIIPRDPSLQNYLFLMEETPFLSYLRNSVVTALGATVFSLFCAVFAGYALSRFKTACWMSILPACLQFRCFRSSWL